MIKLFVFEVSLFLCLCFFTLSLSYNYKPVVIIHGLLDKNGSMVMLEDRIREKHPGTDVYNIDKYHGWRSLAPLWRQVEQFGLELRKIMAANPQGVNLIGYSQGGLISRGIIEAMDDHCVKTFISLSSPQAGQYGDEFLHIFFPTFVKGTVYEIFYSDVGQYTSVANYWNDPLHHDLYIKYSDFLAEVNNERVSNNSARYKQNFQKLTRLVLIGGQDDDVITPWQSSHFSYYNDNQTVVDFRERDIYKNDMFGLKTLDKKKKLIRIEVPGITHLEWHQNLNVIDNSILPYLD